MPKIADITGSVTAHKNFGRINNHENLEKKLTGSKKEGKVLRI
jgi:hypothetical protein